MSASILNNYQNIFLNHLQLCMLSIEKVLSHGKSSQIECNPLIFYLY